MSRRPSALSLAALAVVTASTLAEQVVITRLFSAVLAYHFSFLAISIALLGTGAAALMVYTRPRWFALDPPERLLARWTGLFALSLVIVPFVLVRLDFGGADALTPGFILTLALACVLATLPPLASGVVVTLAIERYRSAIGLVYAFDLGGAGIGALAVVPALWLAPAPDLLVWLGALNAMAALFLAPKGIERKAAIALLGGSAIALGLSSQTDVLYLDPGYRIRPGTIKVAERWTPLARVFGYDQVDPAAPGMLFYDRVWAPVAVAYGDDLPNWKKMGTGPASVGFAFAGPGRTLIIGGGGGRDIYTALTSKQNPVHVIELLEGNRRVVDEDLGYLSGSPYSRAGVSTVIGDGRSVLARRDEKYDQIHIGFTDTLTANAAQGFALTENNLYTVEAFDEYLDHLTPKGILNVSRAVKLVGDEALRVTVLTLAALERRGIEDPFRHVIVVAGVDVFGPPTGTVLARLTPYTPEEVKTVSRLAKQRAKGLLLAPGAPNRMEWKALAEAGSVEAFCKSYPLDVCPPTDDKPFFFNMARLSQLGRMPAEGYIYSASPTTLLLITLGILALLSAVGLALPMRAQRSAPPTLGALSYFAAIGLGFLLLEIVLIQRLVLLLGYPTYALSVVLFTLLLSSGLGSLLTSRFSNARRALLWSLGTATALIGLSAVGLQPLVRALIDLPFGARAAIAVAVLAPVGLCLGTAMPVGLARLSALHPEGVAYAWGVNGITSVLASVLGVAVAMHFGFTVASLLAAACYLFALAHAAWGRWPEQPESP